MGGLEHHAQDLKLALQNHLIQEREELHYFLLHLSGVMVPIRRKKSHSNLSQNVEYKELLLLKGIGATRD